MFEISCLYPNAKLIGRYCQVNISGVEMESKHNKSKSANGKKLRASVLPRPDPKFMNPIFPEIFSQPSPSSISFSNEVCLCRLGKLSWTELDPSHVTSG